MTRSIEHIPKAAGERRIVRTPASDIRSEKLRWLDRGRAPLRGLTFIAGEKGLGKSTFTNAYVPAKLTRGTLDGDLHGNPVDVLLVTGEDDWATIVKPRLLAHGADLTRVHRLAIRDHDGTTGLLTLPDDVPLIEQEIETLRTEGRTVGCVVVDPIGAFLSNTTDSHKDASVRRAIAPLAAMVERLDLAGQVVGHLTKDETARLINRVNGSGAFVNAARSVLGFCRDPDDPDGEEGNRRVLIHAASNWGRLAPTLTMTIEGREVEIDDGSTADVGYLKITGETQLVAGDLQQGQDGAGRFELARHWLLDRLGEAWVDSGTVKTEGKDAGHAARTLQRVFAELETEGSAEAKSEGFPRRTYWRLRSRANHSGATESLEVGATGTNGSVEPNLAPAGPPVAPHPGVARLDVKRRLHEIACMPDPEQAERAWNDLQQQVNGS